MLNRSFGAFRAHSVMKLTTDRVEFWLPAEVVGLLSSFAKSEQCWKVKVKLTSYFHSVSKSTVRRNLYYVFLACRIRIILSAAQSWPTWLLHWFCCRLEVNTNPTYRTLRHTVSVLGVSGSNLTRGICELSSSINGRKFRDQLSDYLHLRKDFSPWS